MHENLSSLNPERAVCEGFLGKAGGMRLGLNGNGRATSCVHGGAAGFQVITRKCELQAILAVSVSRCRLRPRETENGL